MGQIVKKNTCTDICMKRLFYDNTLFFIQAMHLVYKALEKYAIPNVLPPELMPPGKRKESLSLNSTSPVPPAIPPLPNAAAVNNLVGLESMQVE